ncbi:MAG: hypothetical protein WCT44_00470 [Candidatus Paceibacterota bacterium]
MKNNFQKIPLITSAVFFIIVLSAFLMLYKLINDNNRKANEGRVAWQTETDRRNEIRTLDQTLLRIAPDKALLDTHFAKSSDVVPFLDTIEQLATRVGAKAEVSSVDMLSTGVGLVVGLKASGSFASLYKFLMLLENSPYELNFLSLDIRRNSVEEKGGVSWEAVFRIQLLSFVL